MIGQSTIIGPVDIILLIHFTWPDRQIIFLGSQYTSEPSAVNTISVVQLCLSLNGQMRSIMIRGMVIDMNDEWRQSRVSVRHD